MARDDRKLATRENVMQAALAEFARVGFERSSIQAISTRAHVSHGTVFWHFGSKAHLYLEVVHRAADQLAALRPTPLQVPRSSFREFVRRLVALLGRDVELCGLIVSVGLDSRHPELERAAALLHGRLLELWRESLGAATADDGSGAPTRDALARTLNATLVGLLMARTDESPAEALAPLVGLGELVEGTGGASEALVAVDARAG